MRYALLHFVLRFRYNRSASNGLYSPVFLSLLRLISLLTDDLFRCSFFAISETFVLIFSNRYILSLFFDVKCVYDFTTLPPCYLLCVNYILHLGGYEVFFFYFVALSIIIYRIAISMCI